MDEPGDWSNDDPGPARAGPGAPAAARARDSTPPPPAAPPASEVAAARAARRGGDREGGDRESVPVPARSSPRAVPAAGRDSKPGKAGKAEPWEALPPECLLDHSVLLGPRARIPGRGWRRLVYRASAGRVTPGLSAGERADLAVEAAIREPVSGCVVVAVISTKGGIGKTTVAAMLGHTLATVRPDRVLAVDGNPDHGNLADKVGRQTSATIVDLLPDLGEVTSYSTLSGYLSQSLSRLQVLGAPTDPSVSTALTGDDYRTVVGLLRRHVNVVIVDCGTGLLDSATQGILAVADHAVIVLGQAADVTQVSAHTYEWLEANGHADLAARSVAVVNNVDPGIRVNLDAVDRYVAAHGRAALRVPRDPILASGAPAELADLAPATRHAYRQVAAALAGGFSRRAAQSGAVESRGAEAGRKVTSSR